VVGVVAAVVVIVAVVLVVPRLTGGAGTTVPRAFLGSWTGDDITQSNMAGNAESLTVVITGGKVGDVVGSAQYDCGSQPLQLKAADSGGLYVEEEPVPNCSASIVRITLKGSNEISYSYDPGYDPSLDTGGVTGGGLLIRSTE
jgi:hypothetical protein